MTTAKNVDEYIAQTLEEFHARLQELRAVIKAVAPEAKESISYGMPYYSYKGRLVYFQLCKTHIGLYIPTPIIEEHQNELQGYKTNKGTIRFPLNEPLPLELIKKLVQARVRRNEEGKGVLS